MELGRLLGAGGGGIGAVHRAGSGGVHQFSLRPAVMLLLAVGWPTSVTAVVTCSGPYSFWSALKVLWVTGSLLAVVTPAPNVVPVVRTSNLTAFWLPQICGVGGRRRGGRRRHQRHIGGRGRGRAEGFGHRIGILQRDGEFAADRDRVLEGGAELALIVAGIDARIDAWRDWARRPRPRPRRNPDRRRSAGNGLPGR